MKKYFLSFLTLSFIHTAQAETFTVLSTWNLANRNEVMKSSVGAANGDGNMPEPVLSSVSAGATDTNSVFETRLSAGNTGADQFTGLDSVLIGGKPMADVIGQLVSPGALGTPSKLSVFGSPDGTYNEGCSVCIFMGRTQWNGQRAAVSGVDYRAGASAITGSNDAVAAYFWSGNIPPYMGLTVDHYDATHVYLKTPLTKAQMALLHQNQYIATNSLYIPSSSAYSSITEVPSDGTAWREGYYKGIVSGWDTVAGTYITVTAWAAPASGDTSSGQIPTPSASGGSSSLDTTYTQYSRPTVFVGAITGTTSRNDFVTLDQRNTSLVRGSQTNEQDLQYYAKTKNSIKHDNIVISDTGITGTPYSGLNAFTKDSRVFVVNSQKPIIFDIGMDGSATLFKSASFWVNGGYGVNQSTSISLATMAEWGAYTDGTNKMNVVSYLKKETTSVGAGGTSVHLGLELDGTFGTPESGTQWGQLVWNASGANAGGIALCGNAGTASCGVSVAADNSVTTNGITLRNNQGITFTPTDASAGSPGILAGDYQTLLFKTSTGSYANISAGLFAEVLTTPASSTAPCTTGQFTDDANYHYVCVAANTWKTSPLEAMGSAGSAYPSFTKASLPTTGLIDGQHARCSDCILNSKTGVDAVWNAGAAAWTDSMNNALVK